MAISTRGAKRYDFGCRLDQPLAKQQLQYLGVAAIVGLPKELFLGRMVISVTKPPRTAPAGPIVVRPGAARRAVKRTRRGRRK